MILCSVAGFKKLPDSLLKDEESKAVTGTDDGESRIWGCDWLDGPCVGSHA